MCYTIEIFKNGLNSVSSFLANCGNDSVLSKNGKVSQVKVAACVDEAVEAWEDRYSNATEFLTDDPPSFTLGAMESRDGKEHRYVFAFDEWTIEDADKTRCEE
jgi:hypothetical protein